VCARSTIPTCGRTEGSAPWWPSWLPAHGHVAPQLMASSSTPWRSCDPPAHRGRRSGRLGPRVLGHRSFSGAHPYRSFGRPAGAVGWMATDAPFGAQPHGATARRSGAGDLCSRSVAFRVFAECARSADLARQAWWRDVALLTIASALDRHLWDSPYPQLLALGPEERPISAVPFDAPK
jgi:hypothetical protein